MLSMSLDAMYVHLCTHVHVHCTSFSVTFVHSLFSRANLDIHVALQPGCDASADTYMYEHVYVCVDCEQCAKCCLQGK